MQTKKWMDDLPTQFSGKRNIEIIVNSFRKQLNDLDGVFEDIRNLNLDTAVGENLDNEGSNVPLTRKEAADIAGVPLEVMKDDLYRKYLKYKILVNTSSCTYYDLMEGLSLLWNISPIYYIEDPALPANIILTMPFLMPGGETVALGEVPMIKPAGVSIYFQYNLKIVVETLIRWITSVYQLHLCGTFLCGQYPNPGTVWQILEEMTESGVSHKWAVYENRLSGTVKLQDIPYQSTERETIYIEANTELEDLWKAFDGTLSGMIRIGGKAFRSTTGEIIDGNVQIEIGSDYEVMELIISGQKVTVEYPFWAINGFVVGNGMETDTSWSRETYAPPASGTKGTGTYPEKGTSGFGVYSEAEAEGTNVQVMATEARRCGLAVCGNKQKGR